MRWVNVAAQTPKHGDVDGMVKVITLDGAEAVRHFEMVSSVTDEKWLDMTPTSDELAAAGHRMRVEVSHGLKHWSTATLVFIHDVCDPKLKFVALPEDNVLGRYQFCRPAKADDSKVRLVLNSHSGDYIDMAGVELPKEVKVRFVPRHRRPSVPRFGESYDEMTVRLAGEAGRKAAAEAIKNFDERMKRKSNPIFECAGQDCPLALAWLKENGFWWNAECFAWTRGHYDDLHEARILLVKNLWIMTFGNQALPIYSNEDANHALTSAEKAWVGENSQAAKDWLKAKGFSYSAVLGGYKCEADNIRFMWRNEGWICYIGAAEARPVADSDCADTLLLMASDPF